MVRSGSVLPTLDGQSSLFAGIFGGTRFRLSVLDLHEGNYISIRRSFGTRRFRKKKPSKEQAQKKPPPPQKMSPPAHIQARPPGESPTAPIQYPDKEKENELSNLQTEIHSLYKQGNYTEALTQAKQLLESSKSHFGDTHPATAAAHMNCGLQRKQLGYFDDARRDYTSAQTIYATTVGKDHQSFAAALHNIAVLNYQQIHVDTSLRATDRLSLVEQALECLEVAYSVRNAELGPDHPHTVATRSRWGATLAAQVLHHHKMTTAGKRWYVSLLPTHVTTTAWQAAEDHLRSALQTAVDTPRGTQTTKKQESTGTTQQQQQQQPRTLSAAAAAQNLAVVLKARATTISKEEGQHLLEEAESLYKQAMAVYHELLPSGHPDVVTAQHSLAELLEYKGDEELANAIRRRIVDSYGVEYDEVDKEGDHSSSTTKS